MQKTTRKSSNCFFRALGREKLPSRLQKPLVSCRSEALAELYKGMKYNKNVLGRHVSCECSCVCDVCTRSYPLWFSFYQKIWLCLVLCVSFIIRPNLPPGRPCAQVKLSSCGSHSLGKPRGRYVDSCDHTTVPEEYYCSGPVLRESLASISEGRLERRHAHHKPQA